MRATCKILLLAIAMAGCSRVSSPTYSALEFGKDWSAQIFAVRERLENDKSLRTDLDFFRAMETWSRERAKQVAGPHAALYSAVARYYHDGQPYLDQTIEASRRLEDAGGADFPALLENPDKAKIEKHATLVASLKSALNLLSDFERRATRNFERQISQSDLDDQTKKDCVKIFELHTTHDQREKLRRADQDYILGFEAALKLVLDDWEPFEQWTKENGPGPFSFSTTEKRARWDELMKQIFDAKANYKQD